MHRYVIGIDPGFTGAIAVYDRAHSAFLGVFDVPVYQRAGRKHVDEGRLLDFLQGYANSAHASIEEVAPRKHGANKDGTERKEGTASVFRFGYVAGLLTGVLTGLGIAVHKVHPAVWKLAAGVSRDKHTSLEAARARCPTIARELARKKDHGRAEAALIALHLVRALPHYEARLERALS